jgi:hypothetical protein
MDAFGLVKVDGKFYLSILLHYFHAFKRSYWVHGWWVIVCPSVERVFDRGFNAVLFKLQNKPSKGFCGVVCAMMTVVFFDHCNTCAADLSYC